MPVISSITFTTRPFTRPGWLEPAPSIEIPINSRSPGAVARDASIKSLTHA